MGLDLGSGELGDDPAVGQHDDAVGHPRELLEVRGDVDDRRALLDGSTDRRVDLDAGADVHALRRLVKQEHPGMTAEPPGQDDLLLVAAGQGAERLLVRGGLDAVVDDRSAGVDGLGAVPVSQSLPVVAHLAGGDVLAQAHLEESRLGCAVLGDIGEACVHGLVNIAELYRPAFEQELSRGDREGSEDRLQELAATGAQQAGDPEHLALAQHEVDALQRSGHQAAYLEGQLLRLDRGCLGKNAVQGPPDDHLHQVGLGFALCVDGADVPAVAEHADPVGDGDDLIEPVRHEYDRLPGGGVAAHSRQEHVDFGGGQRRGGLVEDKNAFVPALLVLQCAGDGDHGAVGRAEQADRQVRRGLDLEALQQARGAAAQCLPPDRPGASRLEAPADRHVLGDRHGREDTGVLVHEVDTRSARPVRRRPVRGHHGGAHRDLATRVTVVEPGEDLDQRRLPGAVAAEQGVDVPRLHLERYPVQGPCTGECLGQVGDAQCRGCALRVTVGSAQLTPQAFL